MRTIFAATLLAAYASAAQTKECAAFEKAWKAEADKVNGSWDQAKKTYFNLKDGDKTGQKSQEVIDDADLKAKIAATGPYPTAEGVACIEAIADFPEDATDTNVEVDAKKIDANTKPNSNGVYNAGELVSIDLEYVKVAKKDCEKSTVAGKEDECATGKEPVAEVKASHGILQLQTGWRQSAASADVTLDYTLMMQFQADKANDFKKAPKPVVTMAMYSDQETDKVGAEVTSFDLSCAQVFTSFCFYFYGDLTGVERPKLGDAFTAWQYYQTKTTWAGSEYGLLVAGGNIKRVSGDNVVPQDKWQISSGTSRDADAQTFTAYLSKTLPGAYTGIAKGATTNAVIKYERAAVVTKPAANAAAVVVTAENKPVHATTKLTFVESPEQIAEREAAEKKAKEDAEAAAKAKLEEEAKKGGDVNTGEDKDNAFYMTVGAAYMAAVAALAF